MTGFKSKRESAIGRFAEWERRQKLIGEAEPPTISIWKQPVYKPPQMATPRPGADDHLKVRSRGI